MPDYSDNTGCELARCKWENGRLKEQAKVLAEALEMFLTHASCEPTGHLKGMCDPRRRLEWYEGLSVVQEEARKALHTYYGDSDMC